MKFVYTIWVTLSSVCNLLNNISEIIINGIRCFLAKIKNYYIWIYVLAIVPLKDIVAWLSIVALSYHCIGYCIHCQEQTGFRRSRFDQVRDSSPVFALNLQLSAISEIFGDSGISALLAQMR